MICRWFNVVSKMIAFLQFAAVFALFFLSLTNFLLSELFARRLKLKISDPNKSQHSIRDPNKSQHTIRDPDKSQHSIRDPNKSQRSIRDPNKSQRSIRDPNTFTFPEVDRALRRESASAGTKRAPSFDRRGREIHQKTQHNYGTEFIAFRSMKLSGI